MSAPSATRCTSLVAGALFALTAAACSKTKPVVCEYAEVVEAGTPGAIEVPTYAPSKPVVHVLEPVRFRVKSATLGRSSRKSATGESVPAISFEMTPADGAAFRTWTTARVQKPDGPPPRPTRDDDRDGGHSPARIRTDRVPGGEHARPRRVVEARRGHDRAGVSALVLGAPPALAARAGSR